MSGKAARAGEGKRRGRRNEPPQPSAHQPGVMQRGQEPAGHSQPGWPPTGSTQAGSTQTGSTQTGSTQAASFPAGSPATGPAPDAERIVARLRPHGRVLFWPSLVLIAVSGAVGYFAGRFDLAWQNLAVVIGGAVIVVLLFLLPLFSWLAKRYVITTRRIVIRRGLFVRTRQELLHSRGYDITVRRNALQSIVRSGDVLINTGLDRPVLLRDIPSADLVQGSLHDLMEKSVNPIAARRQAEQSGHPDETTSWGRR